MSLRLTALTVAAIAALPTLPAWADVNIYSYRQPELIQPVLDGFTEATGIRTNVAYIDKGLTERLVAEGRRSPADIILTTDVSRLAQAVAAGVTQPIVSETVDEAIPPSLRHPDGQWVALTTRARIVYASKDRVDPAEVTTYEDLADPKWKGRICTRSGTHVYTLGLVSAMIEHHGEDYTRTWLEGVKANLARHPEGGDRAQVRAIWAKQCDIALGNTYYMGAMLNDPEQTQWANSVDILFPTFENAGTHINVSGMAMTAASPNPDDAKVFIDYLVSHEAQEIYAEAVHEYPAAKGAEVSPLVASWGEFTADDTNLEAIAAHRAQALRLVEQVDFDG